MSSTQVCNGVYDIPCIADSGCICHAMYMIHVYHQNCFLFYQEKQLSSHLDDRLAELASLHNHLLTVRNNINHINKAVTAQQM